MLSSSVFGWLLLRISITFVIYQEVAGQRRRLQDYYDAEDDYDDYDWYDEGYESYEWDYSTGCMYTDEHDYRGNVSVTKSGRICQKWTYQSPHSHTRTPDAFPKAGLGDHNHCRNPDQSKKAWCFTMDPNVRLEECSVQCVNQTADELDPKLGCVNGIAYRGRVSKTESGKLCQAWNSQYPQSHEFTPEDNAYAGLGDHNYCRNPNHRDWPWCFTTDPNVPWEKCNLLAICEELSKKQCSYDDERDYRGTISITRDGRTCQKWSDQFPHQHDRLPNSYEFASKGLGDHNYCRNPDDEALSWCYTTDPNVRWDYCDTKCRPNNCKFSDGRDYRGLQATTINGNTCRPWKSSPDDQSMSSVFADLTVKKYPGAGLVENYCRNPNDSIQPWCFIDNDESAYSPSWEFCKVDCNPDPPSGLTYSVPKALYRVGVPIPPNQPVFSHGSRDFIYSLSSTQSTHTKLPDGLVLCMKTGIITGTPTKITSGFIRFIIDVTNAAGKSKAKVHIKVVEDTAPSGLDKGSTITTFDGTAPRGSQCHFPFKYEGRKKYTCIIGNREEAEGELWCAAEDNTKKEAGEDYLWGKCLFPPGEAVTSHGTAAEGSLCIFPFEVEKKNV